MYLICIICACVFNFYHTYVCILSYVHMFFLYLSYICVANALVYIKGCDSCVQILAGLERISICVIVSLQELSFSDKWILCRP